MIALYSWIGASLGASGLLVAVLAWMHRSPRFASRRIKLGMPMRVSASNQLLMSGLTGAFSLVMTLGVPYALHDLLFTDVAPTWWWGLAQGLGVLLVYDFLYYFLHRLMHVKALMPLAHYAHHRAVNPSAIESFYQHPFELLAGMSLFFFVVWLFGPLHAHVFGALFFVYTTVNVFVHSGLQFGTPLLAPIDFLTRKHHTHHLQDGRKNFSSLTPFWDLMFGTSM